MRRIDLLSKLSAPVYHLLAQRLSSGMAADG
jgi:hypothetical protein